GLHVGERLIARGAGPGRLRAGAGALQVRGRLRGLCRIDAWVDLVERLALADDRPFAEQSPENDSRDLGPHFRHLVGGYAAGQLLLDRCTALLDDDEIDRLRAAGPTASAALRSALSIAIAASG